jgi:glycosyltransferase involved in cell wall biosynthesis
MTIDPRVRLVMVNRLEPERLPPGDVVVATYWTTARLLPNLAPVHGRPVHLVQEYEIWGVPDPSQVDTVLRYGVPKIAVSRHLSGVMQRLGVPHEQITVVPNGLDHSVFHPPPRDQPRGQQVAMLFSGSDQKDSASGLAALQQVHQRAPGLVVNAFGVGRRPRRLPSWIRYARGHTEHALARQVYQPSAVYLCSSASEGWALPPAEAMACGAAIVSTRNGGIEDYAVHKQNALLVDVGDTVAMADAVTELLHDEPQRARLVEAGYRTTAPMDWSTSATAFLAALESAASTGSQ